MRLAIVGGKLQGTEAAYLAGEAGYEVVLIDRRAGRPAAGLAGETHVFDVTSDPVRARDLFLSCDAVLPACEDDHTLAFLASFVPGIGVPLLFDLDAYAVTSSKLRSNALFERLDVPRPTAWPCRFPVVVKPAVGSGSAGVSVVSSEPALELARARLAADGADAVVEEFVSGPSLSIEIVSLGGEAVTLLPTWLEFDAVLDCKRVVAPVDGEPGAAAAGEPGAKADGEPGAAGDGEPSLATVAGGGADCVSATTMRALEDAARRLAEGVALGGVMDVEVMVAADGTPKVIEIDARLPSQTPAAVFHASDVNIVALLAETFAAGRPPAPDARPRRGAVYEHVLVADGKVEVLGEHIVGSAGPLSRCDGLYGADVVLTDHPAGGSASRASRGAQRASEGAQERWVAVLMTRGATAAAARSRAAAAVARLADEHGLELVPERGPQPASRS